MAYHLHRLHLIGEPLRKALNGKADISTALTHARMNMSRSAIIELATCLGIAADDLTRSLTDDEARQWSFFRSSAKHHAHVWSKALEHWKAAGLTQRDVANITGIPQPNISNALRMKSHDTLDWKQANALLDAAGAKTAPESLLPLPDSPDFCA